MSIERVMNYIDAVSSLASDKYIMCSENGEVTWKDDATDLPTESEIQSEIIRLQADYDAQLYARNRVAEYPSNGDQWDMIYKDNLNSTTTHKDAVEAVKTKWPKNNTGPVE